MIFPDCLRPGPALPPQMSRTHIFRIDPLIVLIVFFCDVQPIFCFKIIYFWVFYFLHNWGKFLRKRYGFVGELSGSFHDVFHWEGRPEGNHSQATAVAVLVIFLAVNRVSEINSRRFRLSLLFVMGPISVLKCGGFSFLGVNICSRTFNVFSKITKFMIYEPKNRGF